MLTIDDNNYRNFVDPTVNGQVMHCMSEGLWGDTQGYSGTFEDSPIPLIPESEWQDRIRQLQNDKAQLPDFANDMGMRIRNQQQTNYCWAFGVARSTEYALLKSQTQVQISPASVAAPIKNFRNQGGWGDQALDYMRRNGFNLHSEWPSTAIDRRYFTDTNRNLAKKRLVLEYYKLDGGRQGWNQVVSCILAGYGVAAAFNWWRHLVCATWLELDLRLGIDNSWSESWGNQGRSLLSGSKKYPDEACVVTSVTAI